MTKKSAAGAVSVEVGAAGDAVLAPRAEWSSRMRANLYVPSTGTPVYAVANAVNAPPTTFTVPADAAKSGRRP